MERASRWPSRSEREGQAADDRRDDGRAGDHRQADDLLRDDVLGRHQDQQEGTDVGDEDADEQDEPDDAAERDAEQQDLSIRGHPTEEQRRRPAECRRQDLPGEARTKGKECGEDGHHRQASRPSHRACGVRLGQRPCGYVTTDADDASVKRRSAAGSAHRVGLPGVS